MTDPSGVPRDLPGQGDLTRLEGVMRSEWEAEKARRARFDELDAAARSATWRLVSAILGNGEIAGPLAEAEAAVASLSRDRSAPFVAGRDVCIERIGSIVESRRSLGGDVVTQALVNLTHILRRIQP